MKTKILFLSIICLSLFALVSTTQAATLYVDDNNCSDSRTYTQVQSSSTPWCTIQKAADMVNPSDIVIVKDGVYTDPDADGFIVELRRNGVLGNPVTFKSENKWGAKIDGNNNVSKYGFICLSGGTGGCHDLVIEGFEIRNISNKGIHFNTEVAQGEDTRIIIKGNYFHDIGRIETKTENPSAIYCGDACNNLTIDSNYAHTIGRLHSGSYDSDGNNIGGSHPDSTCTDASGANLCYNHDHFMYLHGHDIKIINNVSWNIKSGWHIQMSGGNGVSNASNWLISNNTFAGNNPGRSGHIVAWNHGGKISNLTVQNNISYGETGNLIEISGTLPGGSSWVMRNNLLYGTTGLVDPNPEYGGTTFTNGGGNIIGKDPLLVNPVYDKDLIKLSLGAGSPAIGKGFLTNAPTLDFDGVPRGSSIDIGAFEHVGSDTTPPAAPSGLRIQ